VNWLVDRGMRPYLLVDDWELDRFRERFASTQAARFTGVPRLTYHGDGVRVLLFDLQRTPDRADDIFERFERTCVPPAVLPAW
jgi:hypothetical protein